jgi:hypothetical protein
VIISHVRLFMIISHVKIIAFQLSLFCKNYRFSKTVLYIKKQNNTWVLGNTRFISRVEHDISLVRCAHSGDIMFNTRNKSGISAHPCIILYINQDRFVHFLFVVQILPRHTDIAWSKSDDLTL